MKEEKWTQKEKIKKIIALTKDIKIALFTTSAPEGIVTRPMVTQQTEFDGDLWFFTFEDTAKIEEIRENSNVNIAYADKKDTFVSIRGTAEVVKDDAKKEALWNKAYEAVFDTHYDDPKLVLIKVQVESAEFWESGSTLKTAFRFVTNMLGKDHKDLGTNETVEFDE